MSHVTNDGPFNMLILRLSFVGHCINRRRDRGNYIKWTLQSKDNTFHLTILVQ